MAKIIMITAGELPNSLWIMDHVHVLTHVENVLCIDMPVLFCIFMSYVDVSKVVWKEWLLGCFPWVSL